MDGAHHDGDNLAWKEERSISCVSLTSGRRQVIDAPYRLTKSKRHKLS